MTRLALRPLAALSVAFVSVLALTASANEAPKADAQPAAEAPASEAVAAAPVVVQPPEPKKPELVLRMGTINMATQSTFKGNLVPLAEAVERDSGGRLKIELGELNKFGRPTELLPKVEKGELDIASTVQGYHPGRFPRSEVMELPMIFPSAAAGTEAMWKLYEEGLLGDDYANLKVLSLYVLPPYSVLFADQKVESPRQLRGVSVRAPSRTIGEALDRLGMVPLGLPFNVSGDYVAAGLLEAVNLTWDTAYTTKVGADSFLVNHVRQGLDLRFAAPALMIVMNKARYDAMPEDLRKILDKHTGRDFTLAMAKSRDEANVEARDRFAKEPGKQVYELKPEHRREIAERIEPVIAKWVADKKTAGIDGQALLARARALVAANEKR